MTGVTTHTLQYVLVTPVRHDEAYLEQAIQSVVAQTIRPMRWVIVSDGATGRTGEIARRCAREHPWIEFLPMPVRGDRNFASKVNGFNSGRERLAGLPYQIIGCMDADLTFDESYFEFMLNEFAADPNLGLAGTPFAEEGRTHNRRFRTGHVSGACQLFRRECFEAIGGYVPLEGGGTDDIANIMSKMKGWRVRPFLERYSQLDSPAHRGRFASGLHAGERAYALGWHPLWQMFRVMYHMTRKPYIMGGIAQLMGYARAFLAREPRIVCQDAVEFQRCEQLRRLRAVFGRQYRSHPLGLNS